VVTTTGIFRGAKPIPGQPYIDVTPAIAPKPFLDFLDWANAGSCGAGYFGETAGGGKGRDMVTTSAEDIFTDIGVPFGSPLNVGESSYAALAPFTALSTPSWNNSYYLDVLPKLTEMGTTGDGCIRPFLRERFTSRGVVASPLRTIANQASCYTFSPDFISDLSALPLAPAGDWAMYIEFCEMYGYQFPEQCFLGFYSTYLTVDDRFGNRTNFLFGVAGNDTYFEGTTCTDPVPTGFSEAYGWDILIPKTNVSAVVAINFEEFYKTYPVSSEPLPDLDTLVAEQLFTYEPPPPGVCTDGTSTAAPSMTPTNMPTSGVTAVGMALTGIVGLVGTFATLLY
jgi:hypothetical protein